MLVAQNIAVERDSVIFSGVSFSLNEEEIIGLIGKSGAGKTTLLKSLAGLVSLKEGKVILDKKPLLDPAQKLVPGYEDIQLVNQDFGLEPFHTVRENIKEKILSLDRSQRDEFTDELLDLIELTSMANRQARFLSGGEQQRLSIARALASEPKYLLLDEPFVHLDLRLRLKLITYLRHLRAIRGTGICIVSHDGEELMGLVDRIIHLKGGRIVRDDSAENLYYTPEDLEEGQLLGHVNEVIIDGKTILFRPNEYEIHDQEGIPVQFKEAIKGGSIIYNIFRTSEGVDIMLSSLGEMNEVNFIKVVKRG